MTAEGAAQRERGLTTPKANKLGKRIKFSDLPRHTMFLSPWSWGTQDNYALINFTHINSATQVTLTRVKLTICITVYRLGAFGVTCTVKTHTEQWCFSEQWLFKTKGFPSKPGVFILNTAQQLLILTLLNYRRDACKIIPCYGFTRLQDWEPIFYST